MGLQQPWRSVARTDTGNVRARNEDAFLDCPRKRLWAVADGMGGHQCGDVASQLIVTHLSELPETANFDERLVAVRQCLHWLNRRMKLELTTTSERRDSIMGSTVVLLTIEGNRGACVWAGDSRCYLLRDGLVHQLTRDHSWMEQLIDEHKMSVEQASKQPHARALTRAIGASDQLDLDVLELEVFPGDAFLLCSDGFYQDLDDLLLRNALNIEALPTLFSKIALGDALDNLTAVVVSQ